jgi:ABC-type polysaccharide/polyol phosphate export permease
MAPPTLTPTAGDVRPLQEVERLRWRRSLRHRVDVAVALTVADLKVRYGRGGARLLKWIADPFALFGVYLVLITVVLDRQGEAPGLSLACSVVPFGLVMATVGNALGAIVLRRSVVLNMGFDRSLIPVAGMLTEAVAFGASLLLIALMMAIYGIAPTFAILWMPVVVLATMLFALALAYPAALIGVWMPDTKNFVSSAVRILYFVAPGLVPLSQVSDNAREVLRLNPLTGLFESYRSVVLYGSSPAAIDLLYPMAVALVLLALCLPLYRSEQRHLAKIL